jgi:putative Mn2+ efflux pump MntP
MYAFAVSIAGGFSIQNVQICNALRMTLFFGLFQALMPVAGWCAGRPLQALIANVDH